MCKFLDNDIFLGNLFIKLIEKKVTEIEFTKIFDYVFYVSKKLSEKVDTIVLVSKERLEYFIDKYNDSIQIRECDEKIMITNQAKILDCFKRRYESYSTDFADALNSAVENLAA